MKEFLKRHKQILLVLAITLVFRLLIGLLTDPYIIAQPDSDTYLNFAQNIFLGQVNAQRTPLYPLFIKLVRFISFSPEGYFPIVIAQEIISLISLVFMYKIIKRYTKSTKLIYIFSFVYSLQPTIWHWNKVILTESLSISLAAIFAWLIIHHLDKPKIWSAITIAIGSFLLIMLRPSFLSVFVIIVGFWIVRFIISKIDRKQSVIGFAASLICVILLFGYMHLNYLQNGVNTITSVTYQNQIMNLIEGDIYQNPKYQDIIESLTGSGYWNDKDAFALGSMLLDKSYKPSFQPQYIMNYVNDTIKLHFSGYIKHIGKNFIESFKVQASSIVSFPTPAYILNNIFGGNSSHQLLDSYSTEMSNHLNIILIRVLNAIMFPVAFFMVFIYLVWAFVYAIMTGSNTPGQALDPRDKVAQGSPSSVGVLNPAVGSRNDSERAQSFLDPRIKWCKIKLDWIDLGFCLIIISQLVTIIIGSPADYPRLFQPALPFLFVLVYKHISEGRFSLLNRRKAINESVPKA